MPGGPVTVSPKEPCAIVHDTVIDLLIPYWGDPAYTFETIASVQGQTDPRWRLTIIDDDYPGTAMRDHVAALGDERIRYLRKPRNEGIIENFRSCVAAASAPLMAMPGADDRLLPTYVEEIAAAAERFPQASIVQPGVRLIDEEGRPSRPLPDLVKQHLVRPGGREDRLLGGEDLAVSLLHGDWLYWPSLAFRTPVIQATPFRTGFPIVLDLALVLDMVYRGASLAALTTPSFEYRRHALSLSSDKLSDGTRFDDERVYFRIAAAQAEALGWERAARAARLHVTSRAYAALTLPGALRRRDGRSAVSLLHHVLGV